MFVLDTDVFSLHWHNHPQVIANLARHASAFVGVSVITVEESLGGWYTSLRKARKPQTLALAYEKLASVARHFHDFEVVDFTSAAIARYESLRRTTRVRGNDLRIAAIALEFGATVVTRNLKDFTRVLGLSVVDWAV